MALNEFLNRLTGKQGPQVTMDAPKRPSMAKPQVKSKVMPADPDDPNSDLNSDQLAVQPADNEPSEKDVRTVQMVKSAFNASATQRWTHEREWIMCLAFSVGNHYLPWRDSSNYPELLIDPDDPERTFFFTNIVGNMGLKKLKARLTMSKPTAYTKPRTTAQIDVAAADEGRDLLVHFDQLFERQIQNQALVDIMLSTSTAFLKLGFDPFAEDFVSYIDENGQPVSKRAKVGQLFETICMPFEIYPDPQARYWSEVRWLVHAKRHSLEYFKERYGDLGYAVKPEAYSAATTLAGWWEQRLDQIYGEAARTTAARYSEKSATEFEYWELPTVRFPKGRLIRCTDSVLLSEEDYPYEWPSENNKFPFVPYSFCEKQGTLWGLNAIHDSIPAQRNIDSIGSSLFDRLSAEKPMWFTPLGSQVTTDDLQQRQSFAIVNHDPMMMPTIVTPPSVGASWFDTMNFYKQCIMDDLGVHEVSKAEAGGATSGVMTEILQEQDTTQLREAHDNIERAQKLRGEWEIALAAQFYKEPRMVAVSQSGDPKQAAMNARSFEALTGGGKCIVQVQPGSSISKSPAARQAWIMELMKSGGFNLQMMPLLLISQKLLGLEQADISTDHIQWAMQQMQQMQQMEQQGAAQAQAQAQQAAMQAEMQFKMQMLQMQTEMDIKGKIAVAQIQAQASMAQEKAKTEADVTIEQSKLEGQVHLIKVKAYEDMWAKMHEFIMQAHLQQTEPVRPAISLAGKLGPQGIMGSEKVASLPAIDDASTLMTINKPPVPKPGAPAAGGK